MLHKLFAKEAMSEAWRIIQAKLPLAVWKAICAVLLGAGFAIALGSPLGVLPAAVILLTALAQVFQNAGTGRSTKANKRLKENSSEARRGSVI